MSGAHLPIFAIAGVSPARELNDSIVVPVTMATGERVGIRASKLLWRSLQKEINAALAPRCARVKPKPGERRPILKPSHSSL